MKYGIWCAVLLAIGVFPGVARADLQQAIAAAQQSGKPLFVIGTTDTCPHCVSLKKRLSTEPELQQLISQYIPLEIKVGTADWTTWTKLFEAGAGVPQIFIVSSQGEELENISGAPQGNGLNQVLAHGLEKAGPPRPAAPSNEEKALAGDAARAKLLLSRGLTSQAVNILAGRAEAIAQPASPAAQALAEMAATLTSQAQLRLGEITLDSENSSEQALLASARELAKLSAEFGKLPGVREEIETKKAAVTEVLWQQATALNSAEAAEEARRKPQALAMYRTIAQDHAGSAAAELAEERIESLGGNIASTQPANQPRQTGPASAVEDLFKNKKLAASYLRIARTFAESRPAKAREYCQKVIELLPDSDEARAAAEIMGSL